MCHFLRFSKTSFLNILLSPFTNVESQIGSLQKERTSVSEKSKFVGLCHSILIDLGQDHQQHPTVHTKGGLAGGGSVAVGVSDMLQVTRDM